MTKQQKIELVTRYLNGETPEELAQAFNVCAATIRYNLTHIYQPRPAGRKINVDECASPPRPCRVAQKQRLQRIVACRPNRRNQANDVLLHARV